MRRGQRLPIPQKEFGFTVDTFNLFQEQTLDGERIEREHAQVQAAREQAAARQTPLLQIKTCRAVIAIA